MDNKGLRKEEIDALSAIYGDDLVIEGDADKKSVSITLTHRLIPEKNIKLNVTMVDGYPLDRPPTYMFSAPWMSGTMKKNLSLNLEKVCS